MAKVAGSGQQKIMIQKRRRIIFVVLLTVTAFSSMLVALSLASFLPELTVEEIIVTGTDKVDPNSLSAFTAGFTSNNLFGFFSGRNVFLLRRGALRTAIQRNYPRIQDIDITRRGLTSMEISITERKPIALWCQTADVSIALEMPSCLLSDTDGFIFAKFDDSVSRNELVTFFTPKSEMKVGDFIVPTSKFKDFGYFLREMKTISLDVKSFIVKGDGYVLSLYRGGEIILDPSQDLTKSLKLIESLNNNKDLGFGTDTFLQKLDYFDLRYTGRAVYRLKGSSTKSVASSTLKNF